MIEPVKRKGGRPMTATGRFAREHGINRRSVYRIADHERLELMSDDAKNILVGMSKFPPPPFIQTIATAPHLRGYFYGRRRRAMPIEMASQVAHVLWKMTGDICTIVPRYGGYEICREDPAGKEART